jgi:glycosyltransferase involved in cell wall biosynthesis
MATKTPLHRFDQMKESNPTVLEVVVPVFNEQDALPVSIPRLHAYLLSVFEFPVQITIADNASTDRTGVVARRLARELDHVQVIRISQRGRGRALKAAWMASSACVVAYMDVDLSTDLDGLTALVTPLFANASDIAIGSRLLPSSRVVRGPKREMISRAYNRLLRLVLRVHFSDAQCGFKAIRRESASLLLPMVRDGGWFFDTELLVLAEEAGLRVAEVPVHWVDDLESRVAIIPTALADLAGMGRLARRRLLRRFRRSFSSANQLLLHIPRLHIRHHAARPR